MDKLEKIKRIEYEKKMKPEQNFGKGELSVFQAYRKGFVIMSDDLHFVSYLNETSIKNISPGQLLVGMVKKKIVNKEQAYDYLDQLKPLIRKEIYELVKKDLKGE